MTTPDILAAAERYRKHLEAETNEQSPYAFECQGVQGYDLAAELRDVRVLARAYVEWKKQDWTPPNCRICGKPTMHMGNVCFSCGNKKWLEEGGCP